MKKTLLFLIIMFIIFTITISLFPVIPVIVPKGYHGVGGEFCGIRYTPDCDELMSIHVKLKEAIYIYQSGYLR